MTIQERELKAWRRQQRQVEIVLRSLPKPDSKNTRRRRFETLHDNWRELVGLPEYSRQPNGVI